MDRVFFVDFLLNPREFLVCPLCPSTGYHLSRFLLCALEFGFETVDWDPFWDGKNPGSKGDTFYLLPVL